MHQAVREFRKTFITRVLQESGGVQRRAAEVLQIQATYLNRLIKELGIGTDSGVNRK
jgi:DNA-binding NtrC family response regulator